MSYKWLKLFHLYGYVLLSNNHTNHHEFHKKYFLYFENQNFAKKLKAACTPDFYLFSNEGNGDFLLYYHGQLDDSRPGNNIPLSGKDLRSAVRDLNQDNSYPSNQRLSLGCNIKWTPGKEPSWFTMN